MYLCYTFQRNLVKFHCIKNNVNTLTVLVPKHAWSLFYCISKDCCKTVLHCELYAPQSYSERYRIRTRESGMAGSSTSFSPYRSAAMAELFSQILERWDSNLGPLSKVQYCSNIEAASLILI